VRPRRDSARAGHPGAGRKLFVLAGGPYPSAEDDLARALAVRVEAARALVDYALSGRLDQKQALVGIGRHLEVASLLLKAAA
jgi:hypothetical protein